MSARPAVRLVDHLPAVYRSSDDSPLARFLSVFDALFFGVEGEGASPHGLGALVDDLPRHLNPQEAPAGFLPWLASWVALSEHPDLDVDVTRMLIAHAIPMYRWRGTRRGLESLLAVVTRGGRIAVTEPDAAGLRVGTARIGVSTRLGTDRPHRFDVHVELPETCGDDALAAAPMIIRRFIDEARPAHAQYQLTVVRSGDPAQRASRDHGPDHVA
jgi:phage tail-like protein